MSHTSAVELLDTCATNYERNAVIQEKEGRYDDAANSRTIAADYRQAIETLQAE
ncbi:hypothetical protein PS934_05064 [Pseudomonas fluorescens]|uniref:hypothetical protein n=1 Tax=Pseudomonas fluorescens TaxID=294 RepID=UPI001252FCFD|nr:hypothetical protein [Pseudomonas fluorescens]VVQ20894.1 hypothetical protein PS934_05064 [Pseudomonas fluorescens]